MKKLKFRKPDEMERLIAFKAQRNGYVFLIAALFVWTMAEGILGLTRQRDLNLLPCYLLCGASLIQTISQLILTRNAVKDDDDSFESRPLFLLILVGLIAVSAIAFAVAAVVLMGVRP